jgi:hypothetical protein
MAIKNTRAVRFLRQTVAPMKLRILQTAFLFAALLLLSRPVAAAHFCLEPPFMSSVSNAELIFSGKITKVERVQTTPDATGEYVVTFKVERSWKGTAGLETRVLWRSSLLDCELPVGEVGDDYLVYTDPSISNNPAYQMPEVSFFNRTAKQPPSRKADLIVEHGFRRSVINASPDLNRADASKDVDLLLIMRDCGCLSVSSSQPIEASAEQTARVSECMACWQRRLKASW